MKSMTGYGSATVTEGLSEIEVQISSVNRRHNEISLRLPKEYGALEPQIRRFLSSKISRGQVTVSVSVKMVPQPGAVPLDIAKAEHDISTLKRLSEHFHCAPPIEQALLELWKRESLNESGPLDVVTAGKIVEHALTKAFETFDENRLKEGSHLKKEIEDRLHALQVIRNSITEHLVGQVENIRARLKEELDRLAPSLQNDDRVLREIVLYADRADVSEELSRIDHHLSHMHEVLQNDTATGKLLEFILQELLREWNTLGSKTSSSEASTCGVLAKMELEKIREQVQNVE